MAIRTNGLFLIIWFAGYHSDVVVLFFGESEHSDNTCFRSIFFYPAVMLLGRFPVLNYTRTIECLEKVVKMNEQYEDGEALYMLMVGYQKKEQADKATGIYNRILELYPDKDVAKKATEFMKPAEETTQESTTQPTE